MFIVVGPFDHFMISFSWILRRMGSDQSSPQKKWHAVENSSAYKHLTLDQKNTLLKLRYDLQTGQTNSVEYVNGAQKFESRAFDTILSQLGLRQQAEYYKQDGVYIGNKVWIGPK